jgi:pimeloyl-ACP methyl ester carboxylesterase
VSWQRHRRTAQLLRWLGPWADAGAVPRNVKRVDDDLEHDGGKVRCYRYEPRGQEPGGVYLVLPGMHYAGPDDPRLDRFCRVLAAAGIVVIAPFLNSFLDLVVHPSTAEDAAAALERAVALAKQRSLPPPAIFSISFGSNPALEVASSRKFANAIGGLVLFGGYHHFRSVIRFAVSGRGFQGQQSVELPFDPLNAPAVFINLLPHLDVDDGWRQPLAAAWLSTAKATWGQLEMRPRVKRLAVAERLELDLPRQARKLYRIGCGLLPGGPALVEEGLQQAGSFFDFTDPAPRLDRLVAPVMIAHGRDDDVIPWPHAVGLRDGLPPGHRHRFFLTGLYGHTGTAFPSPSDMSVEASNLFELVYTLGDVACGSF